MSRKLPLSDQFRRLLGFEKKASLAAPDAFLFDLFGAMPTIAGVTVTPYSAMSCAPVASAVRTIAESISQLPLNVYEKLPGGGKKLALDHPLYKLLHDAPNPWTPSSLFRSQVTADALLQPYGGFAQIVRVDGKPFELIRLDPQLSSVTIDYTNFEPAYAFRSNGKDAAREIAASDILHVHTPAYNPSRGLVGEGREAIGLAMVLEQYAARLFGNGARPSGVLNSKGPLNATTLANIKAAWNAAHGATNGGGTAILPGDVTWTQMTLSSTDAQFLEMRKFSIAEIARIFRVPLHLLAELNRSVPRSIESLGQEFLSTTLLPHITRWEQELELKLLAPEERAQFCIQFDVDGFARADLLARSQALSAAVSARILCPNEARSIGFGLPAYEGGDTFENFNTSSAHAGGALNTVSTNDSESAT